MSRLGLGPGWARFRLEMRDPAASASFGQRVAAVLIGLVLASALLVSDPALGMDALSAVWRTTVGTELGLSQMLQLSIGLVLTGCAFAIAFRAKIWNIGMEGQLFAGAWAATATAFALPSLEGPVLTVLMMMAGIVGGAAWALIPALLRAYLDVSEIITTLMLNFAASLWLAYWVTGPWQRATGGAGTLESEAVPEGVRLGALTLGGVRISYGLLIALIVAVSLAAVLRYTIFGYRLQFVGSSQKVALYAGVPVRRYIVMVMLLSGGIAGLAGVVIQLSQGYRYSVGLSDNTGYLGVVIGAVAAGSLAGSALVALFLGFLAAAGSGLRLFGASGNSVMLLVGVILICVALSDVLARYRVTKRPKSGPQPPPSADAGKTEPVSQGVQS